MSRLKKRIDEEIEWIKPPMGLRPKWVHDINRFKDIIEAIGRYDEVFKEIPPEWIVEACAIYDAYPNYIKKISIKERARIGRAFEVY